MNHLAVSRRGFTLIELLVVISIIALLISVLLPSLASARDTARAALCLNNQKQIVLAQLVYANEHDQNLPPADPRSATNYPGNPWLTSPWYQQTWLYFTQQVMKPGIDSLWPGTNADEKWMILTEGVLHCPASDWASGVNSGRVTYGMNWLVGAESEGYAQWSLNRQLSTSHVDSIVEPSVTMLTIDASTNTVGISNHNHFKTFSNRAKFRHNNVSSANLSFIDGHATNLRGDVADASTNQWWLARMFDTPAMRVTPREQ